MKIRTKTLSVIALAVVFSALANFVVLKALVFPSFIAMELDSAKMKHVVHDLAINALQASAAAGHKAGEIRIGAALASRGLRTRERA